MRTIRRGAAVSCIAACALTLAACSPTKGSNSADRVSIESITQMGYDDYTPEDQLAKGDQVQSAIATCMAERGWEYIPVSYPIDDYELPDEDEEVRIRREGLGIAYWTLNQGGDEFYGDPWEDFVDPNAAITDALTEAELADYFEALYGTIEEQAALQVLQVDPDTGEEYYVSTGYGAGCQGDAYDAVYGDLDQAEAYWEAVSVFYEELSLLFDADPRIVKLNEDWASCMAAAGFEYRTRAQFWEGAYSHYLDRHDEILGPDYYSDPFEGWSQAEINDFFANASEGEIDALFDSQQSLSDAQRAQLEELLASEIEIALANYGCEKDFRDQEQDIYADVEAAYAEENRAELEALAASLRADS